MRLSLSIFIAAALLGGAVAHAAGKPVYRWVDENGAVHYSDQPPADADAERITVRVSPAPTPEADPVSDTERELAERRAQDAEAMAAYEREERQALAKACEGARERVVALETARKVTTTGDDGVVRHYTDAERAAALAEARARVKEWCK